MADDDAIRCDACPVLCYIKPGRTGACDRYANDNGQLVRIDPHVVLDRAVSRGDSVVPFLDRDRDWDGNIRERSGNLRHRHWRGHYVSRLQACSVHHFFRGPRRGRGHGGHGRHLQLLRREGEDRYRPPLGARRRIWCAHRANRSDTSPPANTVPRCSRSAVFAISPAAAARKAP